METIYEQRAKIFKAFCDERRQRILELLQQGEQCACKLIEGTGMPQSTLSYHMKILCESGIVKGREVGKWTHYHIDPAGSAAAMELLRQITTVTSTEPACTCSDTTIKKENSPMNTKLYVITGFLGSGKTTLLLNILNNLKGHKVGIIQNEFGKLSIDGDILRSDDIQMIEITRGSIFCSCLKLSFVAALSEMAQQDFEYLFVESSGLGDPSNVEEILAAAEVAAGKKFDFRGVLCMVDAYNFLQQVEDEETVNRQLKHCHLAAITKSDLVDPATLEAITEKIRTINPICRLEESRMGQLPLDFLADDLLLYQWAEGEESINLKENKPKTLFLNFEGEVSKEALIAFFQTIIPSIYRSKGFFRIAGEGWMQVDVVGSKIDFKPCDPGDISQLVFISKIGPAVIKEIMTAWDEHVKLPMKLKN
ncbi:MAG: metalloregulator ArsR/SmtB family transcription factor [Faecousia sp.]